MKNMRKIMALMLSLVLMFSLAACGTKKQTPADVFAAMQEKTQDIKDFDASMKMDIAMAAQGQELNMVMDMAMQYFSDPIKVKVVTSTDMGLGQPVVVDMYLSANDDKFVTYANINGQWTKQELDKAEFEATMEQYKGSMDVSPYIKNPDSFKAIDDKVINDVKTAGYAGTLSGEALEEVMKSSGMLEQLGATEIDSSILDGLKDIPINIYVNKETSLPVQIEMDMKEFMVGVMQSTMEALGQAEEFEISKCDMILTYNSVNNTADFEIPAEALNAQ